MRTLQRNIRGSVGNVNLSLTELNQRIPALTAALGLTSETQYDGVIWKDDFGDYHAVIFGRSGFTQENWITVAGVWFNVTPSTPIAATMKTLVIKLSQSGVGVAPTVQGEIDGIGIAHSLAYDGLGTYSINWTTPIANSIQDIHISNGNMLGNGGAQPFHIGCIATSDSSVQIKVGSMDVDASVLGVTNVFKSLLDDVLDNISFFITVPV